MSEPPPPSSRPTIRGYGYVRVSTGSQAESHLGIEAQEAAIQTAAQRMNVELQVIHRDEAVGGAVAVDERPGLLQAIDSLEPGDILMVGKRDRLGRDAVAVAMIERLVERKGARVVSALEEGANGDDASAVLMKRMLDAFAEFERLLISSRTKAALKAKRDRGERTGNPPFGYRLDDHGQLIPHRGELRIIEGIALLRSRGCSVRQIVDELRRHGVVGRRKTPLAVGQVWSVLKKLRGTLE